MAEGAVFDAQAVTNAVAEGIAKIENASTMEELKAIKTQYAGAESAMTQASKAIGALPKDQKKDAGKIMASCAPTSVVRMAPRNSRSRPRKRPVRLPPKPWI